MKLPAGFSDEKWQQQKNDLAADYIHTHPRKLMLKLK